MDVTFDSLINLQKIDNERRHVSLLLENIPKQVAEIERKIKESAHIVERAKERLSLNQKKRRELEAQVKDIKVKITKYKIQLNEVKTNKEYTSLLKEIDEATKKIDSMEEEIIGEMLTADDTEKEIQEATRKSAEQEEKFLREKEALNHSKEDLDKRLHELTKARETLLANIPAPQVKLYQDIFKKKNGIALSQVKGDFCSLCHMRIRPQMLNELIGKETLIFCENCGRILYWLKE